MVVLASKWEPAPSGSSRAPPAWAMLVGALGSVGTDLRRTMAPLTPAEAGGVPDDAGGRTTGGTARGAGGARDGQKRGSSPIVIKAYCMMQRESKNDHLKIKIESFFIKLLEMLLCQFLKSFSEKIT